MQTQVILYIMRKYLNNNPFCSHERESRFVHAPAIGRGKKEVEKTEVWASVYPPVK